MLFLSCLKATELIEKKFHVKLNVKEKLQLKVHMLMCEACELYEKQSALIDQGVSEQIKNIQSPKEVEALKKQIIHKLNQA